MLSGKVQLTLRAHAAEIVVPEHGIGVGFEQFLEPLTGARQIVNLQVQRAQIQQSFRIIRLEFQNFVVLSDAFLVVVEGRIETGQKHVIIDALGVKPGR